MTPAQRRKHLKTTIARLTRELKGLQLQRIRLMLKDYRETQSYTAVAKLWKVSQSSAYVTLKLAHRDGLIPFGSLWRSPRQTEERKAQIRKTLKKKWADPEFRARMLESSRRGREAYLASRKARDDA